MSTNKPRIQAYIETALYDQFEQERLAWELSQSQALERILLERYQGSTTREPVSNQDNLTPLINSISELRSRISRLEDELESKLLSKFFGELPSELELVTSELPSELELVTSELPSELELVTSELPSELELVTSELPNKSELTKGLSQRDLAKRLNCSHPYIKELAVAGSLSEWSWREDPQGLPWELRGKKYYPVLVSCVDFSKSLPGDQENFVVYEFDKETNQYRYWSGGYRMFDNSLHHACKYKSEETASKSLALVENNEAYLRELDNYQAGRFTIGFETVEYLAHERKRQRNLKQPA